MCGIAGLYLKNPDLHEQLGELFTPMLVELTDRGPDSAGIAVYREDEGVGTKVTAYHPDPGFDWHGVATAMGNALGESIGVRINANHAILSSRAGDANLRAWLESECSDIRIMSSGHALEIYKDVGLPADVCARFGIEAMAGSHAIGHTRMATESAVTTEGAHPFSTGEDLCLVHNGSLSNHNRLREWLRRHAGIQFQTENDTEVAAAYLTWRLREGDTVSQALEGALRDLDGFFTFAVGTRDGFSVVRDAIACKHAILAETGDWVAMATEYRALARLPGVEKADVWEPKPATIYTWGAK